MILLRTLGVALLLLVAMPALAEDGPCASPRVAADSIFQWQKPGNYDAKKAAQCMDVPEGGNGARLAVQFRQLLDARGLLVPVATLSRDPEFADEEGNHRVVPMDQFPVMVLEKHSDGRWVYSRETVQAIPELYAATFSPLSLWFQNQLPSVFYNRFLGLYLWQYLYAGLLVGLALIVGTLVRLLLRNQVARVVKRSGLQLDLKAYAKTNGPIVTLVSLAVIWWGLTDLQLGIQASQQVHQVVWLLMLAVGTVAMIRFVHVGAQIAASWADRTENRLDDQLIPLIRQATTAGVMVLGVLYILDAMGLDVWKLAAGVGIGGLAFALAAQDTVANVFGSVNIFVDRPFQIGDWVVIGDVEGVVEEVGFRSTRVRTFYNSLVTIPNSQITNANVDNMGLRPRRRVKMMLSLTYDTPPDKIHAYVEGVRAILASHPFVQRTYEVHLYNLGASSIDILVYYHVVVPGWHEELVSRSQNILEFIRLADDLGVSFAFPSQSLYLESTPDKPLQPHPNTPLDELESIAAGYGPNGNRARPTGPEWKRSFTVQARGANTMGSADDGG